MAMKPGMEFGIVTRPSAWLCDKSGEHAVDEVFMGWAVGILEKARDRYQVVTHYGYRGYLERGAFVACTAEALRGRDQSGRTLAVRRAFADVTAGADVRSKILCTLNRGSFVIDLSETQNGYRKILLADGREGYLPCVTYEMRKEDDGYLYCEEPENYFCKRKGGRRQPEARFRKRLVMCARSYLGVQYRWAGKSASGIDCSGLMFMCYLLNGELIYRDARIEEGYPIHRIPLERAKPGDLLYFPGHIAMYIGNRKYIHATGNEKSFGCVINSLSEEDPDYRKDLADRLLTAGSIM